MSASENVRIFILFYRVISFQTFQGFDTSTITLSSFILFMAMHPECQEKAYKEQLDIMGDSLNAPTPLELSQMNYLWMSYQETLRLVGVPAFLRVLSAEHKIGLYQENFKKLPTHIIYNSQTAT